MKKQVFIASLGRIELILKDSKVKKNTGIYKIIDGKQKIGTNSIKNLLLSEGMKTDSKFIVDKRQHDCYYKLAIGKEIIRVELNYGFWKPQIKRISIVTQPRTPSKKTFLKFAKIIDKIVQKTSMKMLDASADPVSIKELKSSYIKSMDTPEYKFLRKINLHQPYKNII
jgi:hypothetical protein